MIIVKVEEVIYDVIGLKPEYTKTGDGTQLILANGHVVLDKRGLNSVLKAIFRYYAIDIQAQRRKLVEAGIGRKGYCHFILIKSGYLYRPKCGAPEPARIMFTAI